MSSAPAQHAIASAVRLGFAPLCSNTEAMLRHMKETGRVPAGVLLGNEEANEVLPCRAHDLRWV